ncbi:hypothetical protein BH10BAC1_BH10BAC1_07140 [soil metagenome]
MTTTQVKKELSTYLPLLTERQQEILLDMVKNLLNIDKKEKRITIDQYNKEIDAAMQQITEGKTESHSTVVKNSKKWLKRK